MNGQKYEKKVAGYLRRHGYHNVRITKTSGDYGVDIIARKGFHRYAVQCKYYSKPVGVGAVQQVVGGMAYYDCDRAIVVTNNRFTRQAGELAGMNDVTLIPNISGYETVRAMILFLLFLILLAVFMLMVDPDLLGYIGIRS